MISIKHEINNVIDDPNAIASLVALGMRLEAVSCDGSLFPWGEIIEQVIARWGDESDKILNAGKTIFAQWEMTGKMPSPTVKAPKLPYGNHPEVVKAIDAIADNAEYLINLADKMEIPNYQSLILSLVEARKTCGKIKDQLLDVYYGGSF